MKTKNLNIFLAFLSMFFLNISCNKDSEESPSLPSGSNSSTPITIDPNIDKESLKFVGIWDGQGPYHASNTPTSSYGLVNGKWIFNSDGTYYWKGTNSYGYETTDNGTWHYNSQNHMLITDSQYNIIWDVIEVTDDSWVATLKSKASTSVYNRENSPKIECKSPYIAVCYGNALMLKFYLYNYLYSRESIMCGICYTDKNTTNKDDFKKIYAKNISSEKISITDGVGSVLVKVDNLVTGGKYRICSFIEDGNGISYSSIASLVCITIPDDAFCMGPSGSENMVFWGQEESNDPEWSEAQLADYQYLSSNCSAKIVSTDGKYKLQLTSDYTGKSLYFDMIDNDNTKTKYVLRKEMYSNWASYYFNDKGELKYDYSDRIYPSTREDERKSVKRINVTW